MSISYGKLNVAINLDHIIHNYRLLGEHGRGLIPVIKSDAYGHGLVPVAKALAGQGVDRLAVGTIEEAVTLREQGQFRGVIMALLGANDCQEAEEAWRHRIMPMVFCLWQLDLLQQAGLAYSSRLPVAIKIETGMSRLGFSLAETDHLAGRLPGLDRLELAALASHLASADDPSARDQVMDQAERFRQVAAKFRAAGFNPALCLANSAAILAYPDLLLDWQRPGIALYGANPFHGTRLEHLGAGLKPAMTVRAPLLQIQSLPKGARISYNGTFTCPADMTVGIVAAGYADAYSRALSNKASMLLRGHRAPVLGRVCMQLTALDLTGVPEARPGDMACLLGQDGDLVITPEQMAAWWGTIPYEVFCLLGLNRRAYAGGDVSSR